MTEENKFYSMMVDTTFKYLFKNNKTRYILEDMIKEISGIDLTEYELVDNELNSGNNIKDYRLDIILKKDNNVVNIEMNSVYNYLIDNKNHAYLYRLAGSSYEEGEEYKTKHHVNQINFNNGYCRQDKSVGISIKEFIDKENNIVVEGIKSYDIYLENYKGICYTKDNKKETYLSFIIAESYEEMKKIANSNEELNILESEIERLNKDIYFGALYDNRKVQKKLENTARIVGYEEGFIEGEEKGKEEGKQETSIEIAKLMLNKNMNKNLISELTNLSISEIEKISL